MAIFHSFVAHCELCPPRRGCYGIPKHVATSNKLPSTRKPFRLSNIRNKKLPYTFEKKMQQGRS